MIAVSLRRILQTIARSARRASATREREKLLALQDCIVRHDQTDVIITGNHEPDENVPGNTAESIGGHADAARVDTCLDNTPREVVA